MTTNQALDSLIANVYQHNDEPVLDLLEDAINYALQNGVTREQLLDIVSH